MTIGKQSLSDTTQTSSVMNNASIVGASSGDVSVTAGHNLGVTGSQFIAGQNVALTGQNVSINSAYDTYNGSESQQFSQSGLSIGLGGGLVSLGQTMASTVRQGIQSGDSRLAAVQAVGAAEQAYENRGAIEGAASGLANGDASNATQGIQLQISIGSSHSSSNSGTAITTANGSSIIGNGNVSITATGTPDANGNAQAGTGDITMTGATVLGRNVALDANNAITLQSAQSTETDTSSNSSTGWNAGVGIGVGKNTGISIFANGSNSHGQGNGSSVTQDNTTVAAGDTLTTKSGGATTLAGAQVSGNTARVDVGGDLTMTSLQDTADYASNQHSIGAGASFTWGSGGSVDFSIGHTGIDSNYASVNQQTGIVAGTGGFDVNVAGHTQLNGAAIASAAPAENNSLTTGSLGFSNIQNSMSYSGSAEGFSTSGGPSFATTSGSASGVTQAAVAPGTITVKSDQQDGTDSTAGLSRDTANANQTVQNTFNLQEVQNDLAFQQAFAKVATYAAGQIADQLEASNPAFAEGGVARDAMHAAVAAIGAALGGGNIAGAVGGSLAGDVLQSLAAPIIEQYVAQVPTEYQKAMRNALNEVVSTAGGALGGAVAGGGAAGALAGANSAATNEVYNRQLRPDERKLAKDIADKSNGQYTQAQVEEQMRLMGMCEIGGGCVSAGVAEELNGRTAIDPGAKWINTGLTNENGNPLIVQALPAPDQALQAFIMANYNSATPGQVPSQFTYQPSPTQIDLGSIRSTTAAVANFGATQLDRTSAVATAFAAAGKPIPYISVPASSIAVWASAGSWLLNGVQQAVSPDLGNYSVSTLIGQVTRAMTANYPMAAPVINEFGNITSNSAQAQSAQNWVNTQWSKLKGSPSEKN